MPFKKLEPKRISESLETPTPARNAQNFSEEPAETRESGVT